MRTVELSLCQTQRRFLWALLDESSPYDTIGFGGARRGGKTAVSCLGMILRRMKYPGSKGLILRKTEKSAVQNLRDEIKKWCRSLGVRFQWKSVEKIFIFPEYGNGEIHLGYCRNENDYEQFIGISFDDICFEEATQHSKMSWMLTATSNFPTVDGCPPKKWATTNPGGPGHGWYKRMFVNDDTREDNVLWIPSLLRDAYPVLEMDPGYLRRTLDGLPEYKKKQWADGNWDVLAGSYFELKPGIIAAANIPVWAKWYAGCDWGHFPDPFAVVWAAFWEDDRGNVRVHVVRDMRGYRMNPDVQATTALAFEEKIFGSYGRPVKERYAGWDTWNRSKETEGTKEGRTIAMIWGEKGFAVTRPRTRARIPGWQVIRQMMANGILTIDPACVELIEELTDAVQEGTPENPEGEDVHKDCQDDLLDALRYLCVSVMYGRNLAPAEDEYTKFEEEKYKYESRKRKIRQTA